MKSKVLEFEPGSADLIVIQFLDRVHRQPIAPAPAAVQLRIKDVGSMVELNGVPAGDAWAFDANSLTLPPRPSAYPALIYADWGAGWRRAGGFSVVILEGWS